MVVSTEAVDVVAVKFPYQQEWYKKNLEYNREVRREYSKKFRKQYPERRMLQAAKDRARLKGFDFDIDVSDITIPEICPILLKPMIVGTPYAPSLDRIDSSKGYIKGNVWVISRKANVMKNDANIEDLKRFATWATKL